MGVIQGGRDARSLLGVGKDATAAQIEQAYLQQVHSLRTAFMKLGGFERIPAAEHHTFERFVAGTANAPALQAFQQASETAATVHNPLFVYGPSGLGKSHLLAALDRRLREQNPHWMIAFTSAERFTNEMVSSLADHRLHLFQEKYRHLDALLVDGIHFSCNRLRTQEEFLSILDHLVIAGKRVVVTGSSLHETASLLASLGSLLRSGLVLELRPPDLEARKSIVRQIAQTAGVELPRDVVFTVANRFQNDMRELEGATKRLASYYSGNGQATMDAELDGLLADLMPARQRSGISPDEIIEVVTSHYQLECHEIYQARGSKKVQKARQVAMYLCRTLTDKSLQEAADAFNASTNQVLYAVRNVKQNLDDPLLARDLKKLRARLQPKTPRKK